MSNKSFKLKISEIVSGSVSGFSDEGIALIRGQTYEDCSTDPYWSNVVLMLHLDQEEGNPTNFIDETGKEVTAFGGSQLTDAQTKYGTHTGYFNGINSYLKVNDARLNLGTGDFTIEFWCYWLNKVGYKSVACKGYTAAGDWLIQNTSGQSKLNFWASGTAIATEATEASLNEWHHYAFVRKSGVLSIYRDGNVTASGACAQDLTNSLPVKIGFDEYYYFSGYIDELRITKGVARYDSNPTKLLMHFDNDLTGVLEETGKAITINGNVAVSNTQSKFGGYSGYFAEVGDNIRIPNHADLNFGSSDFTVEFWMYRTAMTNSIVFAKGIFGINTKETGTIWLFCSSNGSTQDMFGLQIATGIALNTWYHIALTRAGSTWRFFVNGALTWSGTSSATIYADSYDFIIGTDTSNTYQYKGYLDEFRVTKGKALYGYIPGDTLLLHFDAAASTGNNEETGKTLIESGSPITSASIKKFGNKSIYLDGSSYIKFTDSSLALTDQDFTVEFWTYYVSPGSDHVLQYGGGSTGHGAIVFYNGSVYFSKANGTWETPLSFGSMPGNTWTHFAITREGTTLRVFNNGSQVSTGTLTGSLVFNEYGVLIGDYAGQPYKGYVDEFRVSNVARYTSNFTPATEPFVVDANTKLLAHFEGTFGPLPITDESGKTVTRPWGNATVSAEQFKFGGYSGKFLSTDALRVANTNSCLVFSGDFTIEFFFMVTAWHDNTYLFDFGANGCFFRYYGGTWNFYAPAYPGNPFNYITAAPTLNQWYHYAIVRSGSTITFYINGTSVASGTYSGVYGNADLTINSYGGASGYGITGYFDEFRIVQSAKYTSNFTVPTQPFVLNPDTVVSYASNAIPPTAPFTYEGTVISDSNSIPPTAAFPSCRTDLVITDPYRSNTVLLLNMNGLATDTQFYDDGINGLTVTKNGTVAYNTTVKKFWNSSAYFNGAGSLQIASSSDFDFGTGDFTIETWMYRTADTDSLIYDKRVNATVADNIGISPRSGGALNLYCSSNGGSWDIFAVTVATGIGINTWYHIALVRSGSTWTFFVNGTITWTGTSSAAIHFNTYPVTIGSASGLGYAFTGYLSDYRVTKGIARYGSNPTKLLMHFDQANILTDAMNNSFNSAGSPVLSSTCKIGSSSLSLNGSSYFSNSSTSGIGDFGTGDFTVECWIKTANSTAYGIITFGNDTQSVNCFSMDVQPTYGVGALTGRNSVDSNFYPSDNDWHHIAVSRQGTTLRIFVDGVVKYTGSNSVSYIQAACHIGQMLNSYNYVGYLDELRVSKGIARYTADFTPSVVAFTPDAYTTLLCHFEGTVGTTFSAMPEETGKMVSVYGNTTVSNTQSKFGGYSGYFDGTGANYLSVPASSDFAFGTGDFTIEFWVYFTVLSTTCDLLDGRTGLVAAPWVIVASGPSGGGGWPSNMFGWYNGSHNVTTGITPQVNTWYHVAYVRKSNVLSIIVNGQSYLSIAENSNIAGNSILIGRSHYTAYPTCYIDELRILKGKAVVPSLTGDTSLLHCDSLPVIDAVGLATWTVGTSVTLDTSIKKFGAGSYKFVANGDSYIRTTNSSIVTFGSSDFTMECWVNITQQSVVDGHTLIVSYSGGGFCWAVNSSTSVGAGKASYFHVYTGGCTLVSNSNYLSLNTWHHLALVRNGTSVSLFIDGVLDASVTVTANLNINPVGASEPVSIGNWKVGYQFDGNYPLVGYMEEFRITKGLARYTASFTPESQAYAAIQEPSTLDQDGNPYPPTQPYTYEGSVTTLSGTIPPSSKLTK